MQRTLVPCCLGPATSLSRFGDGAGSATWRALLPGSLPDLAGDRPLCRAGQNGLMRVVATRIEQDGTMQCRVVDTAYGSDRPQWEDLAKRALAIPPPYRPVPGCAVYHISADDSAVMVAEHDLCGPLLDLVTAVLAMGSEVLAWPVPTGAFREESRHVSTAEGYRVTAVSRPVSPALAACCQAVVGGHGGVRARADAVRARASLPGWQSTGFRPRSHILPRPPRP
jgi:hypothetical protein